jgi:ribosomal protein S27E
VRWPERLRLRGHRQRHATRLVDCQRCGSEVVNPVAWEAAGETRWWIRLRCGECGFVREVVASNEEAAEFEAELDRGVRQLASIAARISRDGMIADARTLSAAIRRGLINADDFSP